MKKLFLILPLLVINLNAEMMGMGESGTFISDKDKSEMNELIEGEKVEITEQKETVIQDDRMDQVIEDELIPEEDIDLSNDINLLPQQTIKEVKKIKHQKLKSKGKGEKAENADGMDLSDADDKKLKKLKLKQFGNVKYDHSFDKYSYENVKKETFSRYLKSNGINTMMFDKMLNSGYSVNSVKMSAFYYDYYMSRPDYAENFYLILYKDRKNLKMGTLFVFADYLLRTGRGDKIHKIISKKKCQVIFNKKTRARCFYYLGVDEFIRTGNRKNKFIKMARSKFPMAKVFYKGELK